MKNVFSLTVDELSEKDGDQDDFQIKLSFGYGGATLSYERKMSEIRGFFHRRAVGKQLPENAGA